MTPLARLTNPWSWTRVARLQYKNKTWILYEKTSSPSKETLVWFRLHLEVHMLSHRYLIQPLGVVNCFEGLRLRTNVLYDIAFHPLLE